MDKNNLLLPKENINHNQDIIVLTFGTFDYFHDGHKYFLNEAKKYGNKLMTIVATDKNVFKIKGFKPLFNENDRKKEVEKHGISDEVFIGKQNNPMFWLLEYKPKFICLGYDQKGFSYMLDDFIKNNFLDTKIIRINSFNPEIYKSSILKAKNKLI